jgi:hypothetical protein
MAKSSVFSLSVDLSLEQARMIVRGTCRKLVGAS